MRSGAQPPSVQKVSAEEARRAFDAARVNANNAILHLQRYATKADPDEARALEALASAVRDLANGLGEVTRGR
jgi:sugar phosphate isomerase/epimerase